MVSQPPLIGVVGGLGPLASAEFVRSIYRLSPAAREQDLPRLVLFSDPSFPDRTRSLLAGEHEELLARLHEALTALVRVGASRIVICCVTIHYLLDRLPVPLRTVVLSLLDVVFAELASRRRRHLMLCTTGTRRLGTFERHRSWPDCREWIVLPDDRDQAVVHEALYRLKANDRPEHVVPVFCRLMDKYAVDACIGGCTEVHLVAPLYRHGGPGAGYSCLDPLTVLARRLGTDGSCGG